MWQEGQSLQPISAQNELSAQQKKATVLGTTKQTGMATTSGLCFRCSILPSLTDREAKEGKQCSTPSSAAHKNQFIDRQVDRQTEKYSHSILFGSQATRHTRQTNSTACAQASSCASKESKRQAIKRGDKQKAFGQAMRQP